MRKIIIVASLAFSFAARGAFARDQSDCKEAWARAARSYLKQNRTSAPDGSVPANMDQQELAAQAWNDVFNEACQVEAKGDKPAARLVAAAAAASVLAKLDPKGCTSFMTSYMSSDRGKDICDLARGGRDAELKEKIRSSIPDKPKKG